MKTTFKRATALLLSLLMVFSVCSTALVVYAADATKVLTLNDSNESDNYKLAANSETTFEYVATAKGEWTVKYAALRWYTDNDSSAHAIVPVLYRNGITMTVNGKTVTGNTSVVLYCNEGDVITITVNNNLVDESNAPVAARVRFKIAYEYTESFVVLGDSMSNGYGMPEYYWTDDKDDDTYQIESELDFQNRYGYLTSAPDAWATIVAEELGMALANLSISGMRPTELRAILDNSFIGDAYTQCVFLPSTEGTCSEQRLCRVHGCHYENSTGCDEGYKAISNEYVKYISNADVIALHLGMNNFGSLVTNKLMALISGSSIWEEYDSISFVDVLEGDAEAIATYNEISTALYAQFGAAVGEGGADVFMGLVDILAYSMAIFARDYSASYDMIRELNDGADIIFVTVSNPLDGITLNIGGTIIPLGDIFQVVVDAANTYMAAYVNNDAIYVEVENLDLFVDSLARDDVNPVFAAKLVDSLLDDYMPIDDETREGLCWPSEQLNNRSIESFLVEYVANPENRSICENTVSNAVNVHFMSGFIQLYTMVKNGAATRELVVDFTADEILSTEAALQIYCRGTLAEGIGIHPSEVGHAQIAANVLANYANDYTGTDYAIDQIVYYITEYYDDAYAYAYDYADQNGYIAAVTGAIDNAYAAVEKVAIPFPDGTTEAFLVQAFALRKEALETLEAAKAYILAADELDQENLDALLALLADAAEDLAAIDALLTQAAVDVNTQAIIPALKAARDELVNVVIPTVENMLKQAVAEGTKKFIALAKTALNDLADAAVKALVKLAPELDAMLYDYFYNNPEDVIAFFNEYGYIIVDLTNEYGDEALGVAAFILATYGADIATYIVENHEDIFAALVAWADKYGDRTIQMIQVYAEATGLCDAVRAEIAVLEAKLAELEAQVEYQLAILEKELGVKLDALYAELEALKAELLIAAEPYKEAILAEIAKVEALIEEVKAQIEQIKALIAEIEATIAQVKAQLDELNARLMNLVNAIKNLDESIKYLAYAGVEAAASMIQSALNGVAYAVSELVGFVSEETAAQLEALIEQAKAALDEAFYNATHADYAIDRDSAYVALGDNSMTAQLFAQYLSSVVDAEGVYYNYKSTDLTVPGSKISTLPATIAENLATVASADLISISYGYEALAEETMTLLFDLILLGTAEVDYNIDLVAKVGPEAAAEIEKIVADLYATLIENGLGITATTDGLPVADAVVIAVKYFAYYAAEYAVYMPQVVYAIHEINPEALIMVNAISNPLAGASIAVNVAEMGLDIEFAFGDYLRYITDVIYVETAVLAVIDEKVVFVPATGIETTYTNKTLSFEGYQSFISFLMNYKETKADLFNVETTVSGNLDVITKMAEALNITVEHSALLGDVNGDGVVTITDAVLVLRFDAQLPDVVIDLSVADVDGNGIINITDAVWILRYDAQLVDKFPASK